MKTYPQPRTWGGIIGFNAAQIPRAVDAIANFITNSTDRNVCILPTVIGSNHTQSIALLVFYNAPVPGPDLNELLSIPHESADLQTRSFADLVRALSPTYTNAARQRCA